MPRACNTCNVFWPRLMSPWAFDGEFVIKVERYGTSFRVRSAMSRRLQRAYYYWIQTVFRFNYVWPCGCLFRMNVIKRHSGLLFHHEAIFTHTHLYMCVYIYVYIYNYIYMEREGGGGGGFIVKKTRVSYQFKDYIPLQFEHEYSIHRDIHVDPIQSPLSFMRHYCSQVYPALPESRVNQGMLAAR